MVVCNWNQDNIKSGYSIYIGISIGRVSKYYKIQIPQKASREEAAGKDDAWVKLEEPSSTAW